MHCTHTRAVHWLLPVGLHDAGDLVDLGVDAPCNDEVCDLCVQELDADVKGRGHRLQRHALVALKELRLSRGGEGKYVADGRGTESEQGH